MQNLNGRFVGSGLGAVGGSITTLAIASSNTFLMPVFVLAEHSRYWIAPISVAMDSPYMIICIFNKLSKLSSM